MADQYFRVLLKNVSDENEDLLTDFCFSFGAGGMAENLEFSQNEETYEPITLESENREVNVFFEDMPSEEFFLKLEIKFPEVIARISEEENKDWMEEWKKGYESFCLAGDYWVVPSWKEAPIEAKKVLSIDPGMAFGTGTHDTTQVAAELLIEHFPQATEGVSLLDVGTGTGILAMLAKHLGAASVVGIEIDEDARVVARENCEANGFSDIQIPNAQIEQIKESFDWVVANIIDGVLLRIQSDLMWHCKKRLLLTGILQEREERFLKEFAFGERFKIVERRQKGEWVGFLLETLS